jgi:hypothetical protein
MHSWRADTKKQYNVYIKKWNDYCHTLHCDAYAPTVSTVLDFLTDLFSKGASYSSINTARSALSAFTLVDGNTCVSTHPLVTRFLKGVFEQRPPTARYSVAWDVNKVLLYLKKLAPCSKLSLRELTLKLTMLLALVTAQRLQTLQGLDINCLTKGRSFVFRFPVPLKQQKPGQKAPCVELHPYPPDRRLCVITVLREYMRRTAPLRGHTTQLLLSFHKPHKPVARDTLARWLKLIMTAAGIDTSVFKAHSTRAASVSAAAHTAPIEEILRTAGWSSAGTFAKFYNKPIVAATFSSTLLQGDTGRCTTTQ